MVMFHPGGDIHAAVVPGSIEYIFKTENNFRFAVRRFQGRNTTTSDPFARWPHFPARLWSTHQAAELELIDVDWVMCQFAMYEITGESAVMLMLPRVSAIVRDFASVLTFTRID